MVRFPRIRIPRLRLPTRSKTATGRSEAVEWQLVLTLYNQRTLLLVGPLALLVVAMVGWVEARQSWFLVWGAAIVVVLVARLCLERAFNKRPPGPDRPAVWRRRFILGAWLMGAIFGCSALVIVNNVHPLVQMFVITAEMVIILGAAARNAGAPLAVKGQAILGIGPVFLACVLNGNWYYRTFSLEVVFDAVAALSLMRYLNVRTVRLLCVNEENLALVDGVRKANAELAAVNELLEVAATTDSLTGIANRRQFDSVLLAETNRAERDGAELSLLLLDVDSFKSFNDLYGHPAGDDCLREIAQALASALRRPADFVARYGGEEFVAILPQTDATAAAALAEGVRAAIEALAVVNAAVPSPGVVTVSIGVASFSAQRYRRPQDFIRAADESLYAAKAAGRNRVGACAELPQTVGRSQAREGALS